MTTPTVTPASVSTRQARLEELQERLEDVRSESWVLADPSDESAADHQSMIDTKLSVAEFEIEQLVDGLATLSDEDFDGIADSAEAFISKAEFWIQIRNEDECEHDTAAEANNEAIAHAG